jgi:hypothetical protein
VINEGGEAGHRPRAVFQPAGEYFGRARRFACLRCVCLVTGEDFLVFVAVDDHGSMHAEEVHCPACGYEHGAVAAEIALNLELIDREEFDFLCSPVELALDQPGNQTLRVKKS